MTRRGTPGRIKKMLVVSLSAFTTLIAAVRIHAFSFSSPTTTTSCHRRRGGRVVVPLCTRRPAVDMMHGWTTPTTTSSSHATTKAKKGNKTFSHTKLQALDTSLSDIWPDDSNYATKKKATTETPLHRMRRRKVSILHRRKTIAVASLILLWYVLSIGYNIYSKQALNLAPQLAWTSAWFQMTLGLVLYALPAWMSGLRIKPQLTGRGIGRLIPVAILHSLVHVGGVVSMGAGAVSFTYIVKASEPAVSALLSATILRSFLPLPVYATLIPVMGGVALASVSELSFNWRAFNFAMMSNVASASRGIVGKKTMKKKLDTNMTPLNVYAVLTLLSTLLLLPVVLVVEGPILASTIRSLFESGHGFAYFVYTTLAALFYYTYNEVAFLCLDNISPISHALASTLKRVFIIISSVVVFRNKLNANGILGSAIAILGVLLYSLAKQKYPKGK